MLLLGAMVSARIHYCYPVLDNTEWKFCAKMAFGKGKIAKWTHQLHTLGDGPLTFTSDHTVEVLIFKDKQWEKVQALDDPQCSQLQELASFSEPLYFDK